MEREVLRKVQLTQLEIAKEIKRVCEENGIGYFLCCGTFLGAVRHQGFIPWDDDLDMGMLREDYEKFLQIAPEKLNPKFCVQSWYTEDEYSMPFAKVRMRDTLFLEAKGTMLKENGFYVDLFPFDYAPETAEEQAAHAGKLCGLCRTKLMRAHYKPWMENDRILWKKRIGYLYYQLRSLFVTGETLARQYDAIARSVPESKALCRQRGLSKLDVYDREWYREYGEYSFEGVLFRGPKNFDAVLTAQFGDYRTLPPEEERENRHQVVKVDFGTWNKGEAE